MITKMYLKEIKQFFRKPFNIIFMLVAPIILIFLMGYAMSGIIGTTNENQSLSDNTVLYMLEKNSTSEAQERFLQFKNYVEKGMDISFEEVDSYKAGSQEVDKHNAIALIKVSNSSFYYYRSPYNEPSESKILRNIYTTFFDTSINTNTKSFVEIEEVQQKTLNSYTYFTFAELGFIMLYLSLIVGQSVFSEKELKTFERIYTSKANIGKMLISKIGMGTTVGIIQISLVYLLSSYTLDVNWGKYTFLIAILYIMLAIISASIGAVLGLWFKKKAALNDCLLIISIIVGLLGGGLTPLSFLDTIKVISFICKISPLYWITNSAISLSNGILNEYFTFSILLCILIVILLTAIYLKLKKQEHKKGVYSYE